MSLNALLYAHASRSTDVDVLVLGAGFAGLTAARELTQRGLAFACSRHAIVSAGAPGTPSASAWPRIGGTWVHWTQPHVWSEPHGTASASHRARPHDARWWEDGEPTSGEPDALLARLDQPNRRLTAGARGSSHARSDPRTSGRGRGQRQATIDERIAARTLPIRDDQRSLLESFWTLNFNGRLDDAAFTQALRWVALTNGDWKVSFGACATYKIAGGTRALSQAMSADSAADIALGADVRSIVTADSGVTVRFCGRTRMTSCSRSPSSRRSIASPSNLSFRRRSAAVERGQLGLGTKIWFTIDGEHPPFVAMGEGLAAQLLPVRVRARREDFVIGFGRDATAIDPTDIGAIQDALARLLPGLTVVRRATVTTGSPTSMHRRPGRCTDPGISREH